MIVTAKLNEEHITELNIELDTHSYLREHGYNITPVETYTVVNQKPDENSGYIVQKIKTTKVPFEQADIVADSFHLWICNCKAYRYQQGIPNLDEEPITNWTACKHCASCEKSLKARQDEDQETLR